MSVVKVYLNKICFSFGHLLTDWLQLFQNSFYKTFPYNPTFFAYWRIVFGGYLTFYSISMLPYVGLLYSNEGIYKTYQIDTYLPNILSLSDSLVVVNTMAIASILASVCIMFGWQRPPAALVVWYIQACFLSRNIITEDPSIMFIGLLLIFLALIPTGEPLSFLQRKTTGWYMPFYVYYTAIVAFGLGFTISAIHKSMSESWVNGEALYLLYDLTVVKDNWLVDLLKSLPADLVHLQTWFVLVVMMLALPLMFFTKTRWFIWLSISIMFLIVLFVLELDQVVIGVLIYCWFIFDTRWYENLRDFIIKVVQIQIKRSSTKARPLE